MRDTPNKGFAVLTRLPSGQLGFRQLIKVVESGPVPLVRVVLDSGHTAVVARDHVFYRVGLEPVPAARLRPAISSRPLSATGRLHAARRDDARPPNDRGARDRAGGRGAGVGRHVRDTHALFLTAGVLCAE